MREVALNAEYVDPSYLRQFMAFETMRNAGTPAPLHFPVRLQLNGQFYQLAFQTDTQDSEMLERHGPGSGGGALQELLQHELPARPELRRAQLL